MYNHKKIEKKWQKYWQENKIYSPNLDKEKKPYYNLMMFPYSSAEGLHVGNMYAFTHSDAWGRYMRLKGFEVFEPIGLDGFGIHSENYAMKINEHIREVSKRTEERFYRQLKMIGNQYDWDRTVETYKPNYYKWTQWLFLKMYEKGLAYRKKSPVNWCPSCKTVLSDEQVISNKCERCDTEVEKKMMEQWFFKITDYAERLLNNLLETNPEKKMDWSEDVKAGQINWIGKSVGADLFFKIKGTNEKLKVFTTRPDTIFGATYMVIAPEHRLIEKLKSKIKNKDDVNEYVKKALKKEDQERMKEEKDKTGVVLKGIKAINPFNKKEIPIFVADYVLTSYGTGAIMAVPAHDERDFAFAEKYDLEIIPVVAPEGDDMKKETSNSEKKCFIGEGKMINSGFLDGLNSKKAKNELIKAAEKKDIGNRAVNYKLRDWCVSRQRYWGPPIPMIYCRKCGWVPVFEKDLPVELPEMEDFHPDGSGKGPLNKIDDFVNTQCPKCGGSAKRETDVSDPFVDSSWYFFRYLNIEDIENALNKDRIKKWMPVDMYIGGKEHTVLHLLYSRFVTMVLHDLGHCDFEEPYDRFFGHGLVIKDGAKMSKSKGNVVNPDEYVERFGADSVRMYLMFLGDVSQGGDWRDSGMAGMFRFVKKLNILFKDFVRENDFNNPEEIVDVKNVKIPMLHKTIKGIGEDLERFSFNTAISKIMEFVNWYNSKPKELLDLDKNEARSMLSYMSILIGPFAPHFSEEAWELLGNEPSVFKNLWPDYSEELTIDDQIELVIQTNGKIKSRITIKSGISKDEAVEIAKKDPKLNKEITGKKIKKIIYVQDKILNFVM